MRGDCGVFGFEPCPSCVEVVVEKCLSCVGIPLSVEVIVIVVWL